MIARLDYMKRMSPYSIGIWSIAGLSSFARSQTGRALRPVLIEQFVDVASGQTQRGSFLADPILNDDWMISRL